MASREEEAREFFRTVYGEDTPGWLPLFLLPSKDVSWFAVTDLDRAAKWAVDASRENNVYTPVALQEKRLPKGRGGADTTSALLGLHSDIDWRGPAHVSKALPPDIDAAAELIGEFPLPPTIIVDSGHGLQPWWLFKEPWIFEGNGERQQAAELSRRWQVTCRAKALAHGWNIDATADLARVLRLPGTMNRKVAGALVRVSLLVNNEDARYTIEDFEQFLIDDGPEVVQHAPVDQGRIPKGRRSNTLASMAGGMRRKGATEEAILAALQVMNAQQCDPPMTERAVANIAHSISRYEPFQLLAYLERGESGDAELFAEMVRGQRCFDFSRKKWFVFAENYWIEDRLEGTALTVAHDLAGEFYRAAATMAGEPGAKKLSTRAQRLGGKQRIAHVLDLAKRQPGIALTGGEWDTDPMLLAVGNGVLDLETGQLRAGAPGDHIKTHTDTEFHKGAVCPRWDLFLTEIFDGNTELIEFLRRVLGYGMTGLHSEHRLPIFHGEGNNGKDTMLAALRVVLGEYARPISRAVVVQSDRNPDSPSEALCDLQGLRLGWASETREGAQLNTAQVKLITGGGEITTRPLYGRQFTFQPGVLVCMLTNHLPHVSAEDRAIWARILLFPFTETYEDHPQGEHEHVRDKTLDTKLEAEASGILNWLLRGCLEWQAGGLQVPDCVLLTTSEYRIAEDTLGEFLTECCNEGKTFTCMGADLYARYARWAGRGAMSRTSFGRKVTKRYAKKHTVNGALYTGLQLNFSESLQQTYV